MGGCLGGGGSSFRTLAPLREEQLPLLPPELPRMRENSLADGLWLTEEVAETGGVSL